MKFHIGVLIGITLAGCYLFLSGFARSFNQIMIGTGVNLLFLGIVMITIIAFIGEKFKEMDRKISSLKKNNSTEDETAEEDEG